MKSGQRPTRPDEQVANNAHHQRPRRWGIAPGVEMTTDDVEEGTPASALPWMFTWSLEAARPATVLEVRRHKTKHFIERVTVRLEDTGDIIVGRYDKKYDIIYVSPKQEEPHRGGRPVVRQILIGKRVVRDE